MAETVAVAVLASRGLWVGWVGDGSHSITGSIHLLPGLAPGCSLAGGCLPAQPQHEEAGGPFSPGLSEKKGCVSATRHPRTLARPPSLMLGSSPLLLAF